MYLDDDVILCSWITYWIGKSVCTCYLLPVRGVQDELDGGGDAGGQLALRHLLARRVRPHRRAEVRHPTAEDRAGTPFNALKMK